MSLENFDGGWRKEAVASGFKKHSRCFQHNEHVEDCSHLHFIKGRMSYDFFLFFALVVSGKKYFVLFCFFSHNSHIGILSSVCVLAVRI